MPIPLMKCLVLENRIKICAVVVSRYLRSQIATRTMRTHELGLGLAVVVRSRACALRGGELRG